MEAKRGKRASHCSFGDSVDSERMILGIFERRITVQYPWKDDSIKLAQ